LHKPEILAQQLLEALITPNSMLALAGGMFPELRGLRLKEIAMRVKDQFDGDLRTALAKSASEARKILKKFPGIADPGADRIFCFRELRQLRLYLPIALMYWLESLTAKNRQTTQGPIVVCKKPSQPRLRRNLIRGCAPTCS
jgi:hypothetical protein